MSAHIASCGILGGQGRRERIGTRYFYVIPEAIAAQGQPWFRWRNNEAKQSASAWLANQSRSALAAATIEAFSGAQGNGTEPATCNESLHVDSAPKSNGQHRSVVKEHLTAAALSRATSPTP